MEIRAKMMQHNFLNKEDVIRQQSEEGIKWDWVFHIKPI